MKAFLIKYKSSIYSLVLLISILIVYKYRENKKQNKSEYYKQNFQSIAGSTMATTYSIKYIGKRRESIQKEVDSILLGLNNSVSTYISTSEISEFNTTGKVVFRSIYFKTVLEKSKEIFELTNGSFDPTVMPLVNAYGFGYEKKNIPDSTQLDSLLSFIGFGKIKFNKDSVWSMIPNVQLDFSAIAKGYGVDVISKFLLSKNITNFMVEIGGEVYCNGKNLYHKNWVIGIINPLKPDKLFHKVSLDNESMATSGNYRNYYEENDIRYSHTINPKTGEVEKNMMLSASIIAANCMTADALATASMVLGVEKSIQLASENTTFSVFYIYANDTSSINSFSNLK